jgi:hypothetical protein
LIAAAPELLALLRESRGDLAVAAACWSDDDDPAVAVFHRARVLNLVCSIDAAIAKVQP